MTEAASQLTLEVGGCYLTNKGVKVHIIDRINFWSECQTRLKHYAFLGHNNLLYGIRGQMIPIYRGPTPAEVDLDDLVVEEVVQAVIRSSDVDFLNWSIPRLDYLDVVDTTL